MSIILNYNSLSLNLDLIEEGTAYPRSEVQTPQLEHSPNATPYTDGTLYEPLFTWDLGVYISTTQQQILNRMYGAWRSLKTPMVLEDFTMPHTEPSPRTRPLATGSTATNAGTDVIYFAQFSVWPTSVPTYQVAGGGQFSVKLTFLEFTKLLAT